jgi:formate hydrogenlyase subunit 3/multisubunit Na+/H+ antiporter MnhD subunit
VALTKIISQRQRIIGRFTLFISALTGTILAVYLATIFTEGFLENSLQNINGSGFRYNVGRIMLLIILACIVLMFIASLGMIKKKKWGSSLLLFSCRILVLLGVVALLFWIF